MRAGKASSKRDQSATLSLYSEAITMTAIDAPLRFLRLSLSPRIWRLQGMRCWRAHFDHAYGYHYVFLSRTRAVPASERLKETKITLPAKQ